MAEILYVIGNGFDRHHGLLTSYLDFAKYLKDNNIKVFNLVEEYIIPPLDEDSPWNNFEENIGNLDMEKILSNYAHLIPDVLDDNFKQRDMYAFPDVVMNLCEALSIDLKKSFEDFFLRLKYPTPPLTSELRIDKKAKFLNFNYTDTLERVYNINPKQINYIHGFFTRDIVFGHSYIPRSIDYFKEGYSYSLLEGIERCMEYFETTYKSTDQVINSNKSYFKSLKNIKEIHIYGHSISKGDLPYFKEIRSMVNNNVIWTISYFGTESLKDYQSILETLKISNYKFVRLSEIQLNNYQQVLPL